MIKLESQVRQLSTAVADIQAWSDVPMEDRTTRNPVASTPLGHTFGEDGVGTVGSGRFLIKTKLRPHTSPVDTDRWGILGRGRSRYEEGTGIRERVFDDPRYSAS